MILALLTITLLVLMLVDYQQTLTIANHPERWHERNPLLGKHPSAMRVFFHFLLCSWLVILIAYFAPLIYAYGILGIWAAIELVLTLNNYRIGIRFEIR